MTIRSRDQTPHLYLGDSRPGRSKHDAFLRNPNTGVGVDSQGQIQAADEAGAKISQPSIATAELSVQCGPGNLGIPCQRMEAVG